MRADPRTREARRKKTRGGYVVHVYEGDGDAGALYVPIVPAWGAAGLQKALERLRGGESRPPRTRRRDP